MEMAVCMTGFLLLLSFITGFHLSPYPTYVFGPEGQNAQIFVTYDRVDCCLLYRLSEDGGDLLLVNSSRPKKPQPDGYQVRWTCRAGSFHITMKKLSMSQSGGYRAEVGRGGLIKEHVSFQLIVCVEGNEKPSEEEVRYDDSTVLCQLDSTFVGNSNSNSSSQSSSLQLFRSDWFRKVPLTQEVDTHTRPWRVPMMALVLDTNSSLEPLAEDLRGRLLVDFNSSVVRLYGVSRSDTDVYCTIWRRAQCQSYSYRVLRLSPKNVFAHEDDNLTLPCFSKGESPHQISWSTPTGKVQHSSNNQTHQPEVMFMLNGSGTGDHSLVIPSVSQQHYGVYECGSSVTVKKMILYICAKCCSLTLLFYHGETVHLNMTEHMNDSWSLVGIQWFRQNIPEPQVLIVDSRDDFVVVPEDLRGRVTVSSLYPDYSLIISNLTEEDSRAYTWRIFGWDKENPSVLVCSEGSVHLQFIHPFGLDSALYRVYAPLIGCVLLGLVIAVMCFEIRSTRGEQTCQSREGQHSGDEDLYDDVEVAEISI